MKATDAEVRKMLERLRDHLALSGNCPICAEVDYEKGKAVNGEHAHWCFYDELKGMVIREAESSGRKIATPLGRKSKSRSHTEEQ